MAPKTRAMTAERKERKRGRQTVVCFDLIKLVRGIIADEEEVEVIVCGGLGLGLG